jgi:hypothetical protein
MSCTNHDLLKLKGRVLDDDTKNFVPDRKIIVQELLEINNRITPVKIDEFYTDSTGRFQYELINSKNVRLYNFSVVGDTIYAFSNNRLGLTELRNNAKFLEFHVSKLVDFTIAIERKSKTTFIDTLYVSWESNGMDGKILYPYKIENYSFNKDKNSPDVEFRWIGGEIESAIKTKVYADKVTLVHWELFRNGEDKKITDTVFCRRDGHNYAYFSY